MISLHAKNFSVVGSSERSEPIRTEALGQDNFAGSRPSPILDGKMAFDNRSGVGIGPSAFSVGCCSSGGLSRSTAFVLRRILPSDVLEIRLKLSNKYRFNACGGMRHDTIPAGKLMFFFGEITGKGALRQNPQKTEKTPKEKLVGKLISGCVHLIEILPTTFKYLTASPVPSTSSPLPFPFPLPYHTPPVPSPQHGLISIPTLNSRDPHQV